MTEFAAQFAFAFIWIVFGYLLATFDKREKKKRYWNVEKEKYKGDWRMWEETTSLLEALWIMIRLRKNGYKSRLKTFKL